MKDIKKVMQNFLEDYKENPEGWTFWTDKSGEFYNIYILREDKGYFIKMDSIYTQNPLGTGTKINIDEDQLEKDLPSFGFRRFTEDELENFMYAVSESEEKEKKKITKKMINKKMKERPYSPNDINKPELVMVGPYNRGYPFKNSFDEYEKIDKELKKKLRRKFRDKYPMYG